jgi:hypothetical protein
VYARIPGHHPGQFAAGGIPDRTETDMLREFSGFGMSFITNNFKKNLCGLNLWQKTLSKYMNIIFSTQKYLCNDV